MNCLNQCVSVPDASERLPLSISSPESINLRCEHIKRATCGVVMGLALTVFGFIAIACATLSIGSFISGLIAISKGDSNTGGANYLGFIVFFMSIAIVTGYFFKILLNATREYLAEKKVYIDTIERLQLQRGAQREEII